MALRHELPMCTMADVDFSEERSVPVRAVRAPVEVGFRNGADLESVAATVRDNRNVKIVAACGSGKSARVPAHLAKALGMLVIHSVPAKNLAHSTGAYVSVCTDQTVTVISDMESEMPTRGVVLISNVVLVARMLSDRKGFRCKYLLFMDESHESDCYTAVLRRLGPSQAAAERFVTATATASPDDFRKRETPGHIKHIKFDDIPITDWNVEDSGKPWSIAEADGNLLVYVEQKRAVEHLMRSFKANGADVYVLTARSPYSDHCAAMEAFMSPETGINVILADYSYRSGYNIKDFCHMIDSAKVVYQDVSANGTPVKRVRNAYKCEVVQTDNRAGRFNGTVTTVARAKVEIESKMCDLEGVELDAAALIYRLFGFKPPAEFRSSPFYSGKVPKDPVDALISMIPLRCIPESQLVDWTECVPGSVAKHLESIGDPVETLGYKKFVMPPTPTGVPERVPTPPPKFDNSASSLTLPVDVLRNVAEFNSMPGPNELSLFHQGEDEESPTEDQLGSIYDGYANSRSKSSRAASTVSYVRSRSVSPAGAKPMNLQELEQTRGKHRRMMSASSVSSATTVEVDNTSQVFEDEFTRVMDGVMPEGDILQPGKNYYYNSLCDLAPDKTMVFPAGLASVKSFVQRTDAASIIGIMSDVDKAFALSTLMDAYNEACAEVKAIKRVGIGFQDFLAENTNTLDPTVFRKWVSGLAEILSYRTLQLNSYAKDMCDFSEQGYETLDSLTEMENRFIQGHLAELKSMTRARVEGGALSYRDKLAERAVVLSVNTPVSRMIAQDGDAAGGGVPFKSALDRKRITAGQVRTRDMVSRAGITGVELGNVRYKLQPDSGLRSVWTRPLMKLIGQGNMVVEVK